MPAAGYEKKSVDESKAPMSAIYNDPGSCSQQQHDDHSVAEDCTPVVGNGDYSADEKNEAILHALPYRGAADKAVSP